MGGDKGCGRQSSILCPTYEPDLLARGLSQTLMIGEAKVGNDLLRDYSLGRRGPAARFSVAHVGPPEY